MTVITVNDTLSADRALRLIDRGSTLVWDGDFQNAKQLLAALGRRVPAAAGGSFQEQRRRQARRAQVLNSLLIATHDHAIRLRRAPDVRQACLEAYGPADGEQLVPLRELLGVIGAHQLRLEGVQVPALGARIHPHYGVFAPTRSEYVDLVGDCPLPHPAVAFDIGTGTGVLAAVLARRGVPRVVATDNSVRAVECARDNLRRLGVQGRVTVVETDLFPPGRADLVVCNPPWIPARPITPLDRAVYDEDGRMLHGFIGQVRDHLNPGGEVWLVLSDLAEHLGLRSRAELLDGFRSAGLRVAGRSDVVPRHRRARDNEVTSLWRLCPSGGSPFVERA
ncbi:class I SAM-dependent methyltransferase [Kribbella sp. NPDC050281]|uniref:class I SAM-dependent methyltransferase n=1 Tax=Kribbella sp. NPDC050281 TaxID=3155515 RepID=UPI0033ECACEB